MHKRRLKYIDSLRGISAVLVVVTHLTENLNTRGLLGQQIYKAFLFIISDVVNIGKLGVTIFFIISGFVIPFSLIKPASHNIKIFGISRFFRLYPAYWMSIILYIAVSAYHNVPVDKLTLMANFTMLQKFFLIPDVIGVFWTLQIELIFYFLCVAIFYCNKLSDIKFIYKLSIFLLVFALLLGAARFIVEKKLPVSLPLALFSMFWGFLWKLYLIDKSQMAKVFAMKLLGLFIVLMPIISLLAYNKNYGFNETWHKYTLTYYGAYFAMIFFSKYVPLQNRIFVFCGTISYSLYLTHPVIISLLITPKILGILTPHLNASLIIVLFMTCSITFATTSYYLIEKPAIKVGRKLIELKITRTPTPAPCR